MDRSATVEMVDVNDSAPFICPACASWALRASMFGFTTGGLVVLGEFTTCPTCESRWRCRYCDESVAPDGVEIHRHLAGHEEVA